jgi:hypothetical protein
MQEILTWPAWSRLDKLDTESGFSRGVGQGLGKVYPYLGKEHKAKIFRIAEKNTQFSIGLGNGLGENIKYPAYKKFVTLRLQSNQFLQAFGQGIGHVNGYLDDEFKFEIFSKLDQQFLEGLGYGIGRVFPSFENELQTEEASNCWKVKTNLALV